MSKIKNTNNKSSKLWGTHEWFTYLSNSSVNSAASYFSHDMSGYQVFRHNELNDFLSKELREISIKEIADVGCGGGHLLNLISTSLDIENAHGIDFVEQVIKNATNEFPKINFSTAALPHIPFDSNSKDVVIASEVLYYLDKNNRFLALNEIYRSIKPGGYIFFTSTLGEKYFSNSSAISYIESKFDIVKVKYLHNRLYNLISLFPNRVVRFSELLLGNQEPITKKNQRIFRKFRPLFNNKISIIILNFFTKLFLIFLSSKMIPKFCENIAKYFGKSCRANIIILAQKRESI